jgi:hypothetical protein
MKTPSHCLPRPSTATRSPPGSPAGWPTHCLEAGVPVHEVSACLGHVDLRTTVRYAAPRAERVDSVANVLDLRHQAARRARGG